MTIDAGLKPEGAPERSPIAGAGAGSGVDAGPKRYSVQRRWRWWRVCSGANRSEYGRDCALPGFARALAACAGDGRERLARAPSRRAQPDKTQDGTIVNDRVNDMWGMDLSRTVTLEEGQPYVFVAVERANSEIVSTRAARFWLQLQCGDFQTRANVWASKFRRPPTRLRLSSALDPRANHFH
jgi:hypothetical protein